ncbi:MAG: hypothetical protein ASARMPREDX12_006575 [Alectoria sarmentosa]|nr:MAG: hypothetical protein ASARMPREDX12_006575 [Alectoria sarmentosa]
MSSFTGLPNVGSLIPSIDNQFIKFEEIPLGRKTCDVCGDFFSITGDLKDCPVGLPCRHVHCFGCTWTWLHRNHACPECDIEYTDIRPICVALEREAYLCRHQGFPPSGQSQVEPLFSSKDVTDFMDVEDDEAAATGPRRSIVRELTNTPTLELEAEMASEQLRTDLGNQLDWQTMYEQQLRKENNRREERNRRDLARHHKKQAQETSSQRAERLERKRVYQRNYQAKETEEQRAKRLETARKGRLARRARQTEDEREKRLAEA